MQVEARENIFGRLEMVDHIYSQDVMFCLSQSLESFDDEGVLLATVLLMMSKTQRLKLSRLI